MQIDYHYDPCHELGDLDWSDEGSFKEILARDKHTRLEGLCIEAAFVEDLLAPSFPDYSQSWWFLAMERAGFRVVKYVHDINEISGIEIEMLRHFQIRGVETYIVAMERQPVRFVALRYEGESQTNIQTAWLTRQKYRFVPRGLAALPSSESRSSQRIEVAINFLASRQLLQRSAMERLFANCALGSRRAWDIDALTYYDGKLLAFEVKQKYPTRNGTFGMNVGEMRLFAWLLGLGVEIVHVILTKPIWKPGIPSTRVFSDPEYAQNSLWICLPFSVGELSSSTGVAPSETSLYTDSTMRYHHLDIGRFSKLKRFDEEPKSDLLKFLGGNSATLRGMDDIPRL